MSSEHSTTKCTVFFLRYLWHKTTQTTRLHVSVQNN